jgi:hypothetical protein
VSRSTATTLADLTRDIAQRKPDQDAYVELAHRIPCVRYDRAADGLATRLHSKASDGLELIGSIARTAMGMVDRTALAANRADKTCKRRATT